MEPKPKIPKPDPEPQPPQPIGARTRAPEEPLNEGVAQSFRDVQPAGFRDHPGSSKEAAMVDSEMDDTIGAE